jgi:HPt (histidine-containing phosphotransfer) domain-containing protein
MDDYITKPVRPEDLQAALERSSPRRGARDVPAPVAPDPIDRSAIAELELLQEEGEPDVVVELLDAYLRDAPLRVSAIAEAVAGGDARALELVAHSLKASSATFGANRLAASCLELEDLGRAGRLEGTETTLARLRQEFDLARISLEAERARRGGSAGCAG